MNRWHGIGRLTAKPELRYTGSNVGYSRFTLAVNRPKQKDKEQETDFIDCVTWRGQAENLCNYQDKGNLIAIEGSIRKDPYEDKDGNKRYNTYVLVNNIEYLQSKSSGTQSDTQNDTQTEADPFAEFGETVNIDENFLD